VGEGPGEAGQVGEDLLTKKCSTIQATRFNMKLSTAQEAATTELGVNNLIIKLHPSSTTFPRCHRTY
jgi:hypothetical protein